MAKQIKYWDEARKEIFSWMEMVADAVKVTMWPKWRNVICFACDYIVLWLFLFLVNLFSDIFIIEILSLNF